MVWLVWEDGEAAHLHKTIMNAQNMNKTWIEHTVHRTAMMHTISKAPKLKSAEHIHTHDHALMGWLPVFPPTVLIMSWAVSGGSCLNGTVLWSLLGDGVHYSQAHTLQTRSPLACSYWCGRRSLQRGENITVMSALMFACFFSPPIQVFVQSDWGQKEQAPWR